MFGLNIILKTKSYEIGKFSSQILILSGHILHASNQDEITVDSAFNKLGYNEISEFLNIHFYEGGQNFIFPWSLEFRWIGNLLYESS